MAIQHVDGYVYSCVVCHEVYPRRKRRGDAVQDELDHHRVVDGMACRCRTVNERQHHTTVCEASRLRAAAPPSEPHSPPGTS